MRAGRGFGVELFYSIKGTTHAVKETFLSSYSVAAWSGHSDAFTYTGSILYSSKIERYR